MRNFSKAKRIVVKLGTNTIIKNNKFNKSLINDLARQISSLRRKGIQVIVVSSGSIGMGLERINLNLNDLNLEMQQAIAAVGQNLLMHEYEKAFSKYNQVIGQLLLTQDNFTNKKSFNNLKRTLNKLLELNVTPVINENDSVATEELIKPEGFSDNDMLGALVASSFNADLLIILTDVEGLYSADPKKKKGAKLIKEVKNIEGCKALLEGPSLRGIGGFKLKIEAVDKALEGGVTSVICKGKKNILEEIFSGKCPGTIFYPR